MSVDTQFKDGPSTLADIQPEDTILVLRGHKDETEQRVEFFLVAPKSVIENPETYDDERPDIVTAAALMDVLTCEGVMDAMADGPGPRLFITVAKALLEAAALGKKGIVGRHRT